MLTLMLSPFAITRGLVVYPRQELEFVQRHLGCLDAQFMIELPLSRSSHALDRFGKFRTSLTRHAQRM